MDIAHARFLFPGVRDRVFLDAACVSLLPLPAEEALARLSEDLLRCPARDASAHHIALDRTADDARREVARLIGAAPEQIALVESTTQGLQIVAAAVPLTAGDNIVVAGTEFLGLAVPWVPRRQHQGFDIRVVDCADGRVTVERFARVVDGRTRLILLSSVQWTSGYRVDLAGFRELADRHGACLVVDAIQQLGAIGLDVTKTPIDFLVCGGHKWLNAPVGRGFLYVHPRQLECCPTPTWGYLNIVEPAEGWANYFATPSLPAVRDYQFTSSARRFEIGGTANYPGNVVLASAVGLINTLGIASIEAHIRRLTDQLLADLPAAGARVVSCPEPECRSGIVTFTLGGGPARDRACLDFLLARRILISQRYTQGVGGLRVSVHFFNTEDDLRQLVAAVAEFQRR
ncbi:MAG: aminotransferase class V-fold PLP-dependent enzyme [Gemmataceae bacterium]|nr:aminotransferase class V-fold PLP-dependent enzyme [Gemmataceae bacterium]MDW8267024.1 aminotransferase class V-fold PLP-dependent enzyme [Gemmataceae bacterium]